MNMKLITKQKKRFTFLFTFLLIGFAFHAKAQNNALNFDGSNDYVTIPHNAALNPSATMTIEAWIYADNLTTNTYHEIARKTGSDQYLFSFQDNGTILSFGLGVAGSYSELDVPISAGDYVNRWVHVAAVYDGTQKIIYRNGIVIGTEVVAGSIDTDNTADLFIGSWGGFGEYFDGRIDEFRLWNVARTQAQIQNGMTTELLGTETGLVACYNFNQGVANGTNTGLTTLNDLATTVGGANNGTLTNFALTGTASNWVGGIVRPSSVRGNMLSLDGVETTAFDHVSIPDNASLNIGTGQLTLAAWVKRDVAGTFDNIIMKGSYGYGLVIDDSDKLGYWSDPLYTNCFNSGANTIPANVWTHVAVVVNEGVNTTLYINGVNVGVSGAGNAIINNNTGILAFGTQDIGSCDCNNHGGNIDEVQIWNVALTQAQIRERMHLTLSGSETGLVAYYQFNEDTGSVIDVINGNNGTLQNGASRVASTVSVAKGTSNRQNVNASGNYSFTDTGLSLNFAGIIPNAEVVVNRLEGTLAGTAISGVNRTHTYSWIVNNYGTNSGLTVTPTFVLGANQVSTADATTPTNLKLFKRTTNSGGAWASVNATAANATTGSITFNNIDSFSEFGIGTIGTSPLPITLIRFDAKRVNDTEVLLTWATASETNNTGFEIEQSEHGADFVKVGFVEGKGNSSSLNNYQLTINNPSSAYYRFKQVDIDGKFEYSPIRYVEGNTTFAVYPNPTPGVLHLRVEDAKQNIQVSLLNTNGIAVLNTSGRVGEAEHLLNQQLATLPAGVYVLQVRSGAKWHTKKVVKAP